MILFQFLDPGMVSPYANSAILIAVYFLLDRRVRRLEERLNKLLGRLEARK